MLPRANILYFDGVKFVEVATGLNFPNGAALSPDGRYLYVPESYPRTLLTFERNPFSGQLKQVNALPIPSNLDNADVAADGSIWMGSHPKAFAMAKFADDPSKPAPSEIFRVAVKDGIPQAASLVYANMGEEIGASSVGAYRRRPSADRLAFRQQDFGLQAAVETKRAPSPAPFFTAPWKIVTRRLLPPDRAAHSRGPRRFRCNCRRWWRRRASCAACR